MGGAHGPQIFGPIERKMLRALQARATFFAFSPPGPRGGPWAPAQGPIERKMLRALQARATFFAIPPPGPRGEFFITKNTKNTQNINNNPMGSALELQKFTLGDTQSKWG